MSLMPSLFGLPEGDEVMRCSNYGSTAGYYANINGLRSQFSSTLVPADEVSSDPWLNHLNSVMNGANSVVLRPIPPDEQAAQNLGLSFLPWNRRPFERTTWGTDSTDGAAFPFNPWNERTLFENGTTLVKVAGMAAGVYFGSKLALDLYRRQR